MDLLVIGKFVIGHEPWVEDRDHVGGQLVWADDAGFPDCITAVGADLFSVVKHCADLCGFEFCEPCLCGE